MVAVEQLPMRERQLHRIADTLDLAVKAADVRERDIRHLFKHQVEIILLRQHRHRQARRWIHNDTLAVSQVHHGQFGGAAHHAQGAAGIGNEQSTVIEHLGDGTYHAHGIGSALIDHHHRLVQEHGTAGRQTRRIEVGRDRHDHTSRAGDHLGGSMLNAVFVGTA